MSSSAHVHNDRIRLTGLSARGYHGVFPSEREEGQLFSVDLTLDLGPRGTAVAAQTDCLDDAVDYSRVAREVVDVVAGEPVALIETLAERVADVALGHPRVRAVEVTVHKPQAPLDVPFDDVTVSITREASDADLVAPAPLAQEALAEEPAGSALVDQEAREEMTPGPEQAVQEPGRDPVPDLAVVDTTATGAAALAVAGVAAAGAAVSAAPSADLWPLDDDGFGATQVGQAPVAEVVADDVSERADHPFGDPAADLAAEVASVLDESGTGEPGVTAPGTASAEVSEPVDEAALAHAAEASSEPAPETDPELVPVVDPLGTRPQAVRPAGIVIALGGNVGGVVTALRQAVATLRQSEGIEVLQVAPLARTAAVLQEGGSEQPDYLNTVVLATTTLSPREVLGVCQGLEGAAGRVRTEPKGPRTLDVDLIAYEGVTSTDPRLTLPHPGATQRAFVLVPWSQADPFAELAGRSVSELAEEAPDRQGVRWLALDWIDSDHLPALPTGQYVAPPAGPQTPAPAPEASVPGEGQAASGLGAALVPEAPAPAPEALAPAPEPYGQGF